MSTTDYVIDLALIALVVLQVRDRRMDARSLASPTFSPVLHRQNRKCRESGVYGRK